VTTQLFQALKGCFVRRFIFALTVAGALLTASSTVRAALLIPGSTVTPNAYNLPSGSTLFADGSVTDTTSDFTATLNYAVYKDGSTGDMDFVYQMTNSSASSQNLSALIGNDFSGTSNDVSYLSNYSTLSSTGSLSGSSATGVIPTVAIQSSDGTNITFDDTLMPGQSSAILIIKTTASGYTTGLNTVVDLTEVQTPGFATTTATASTPEPSSIVLLGMGITGLGVARWRKRKQTA
jgi:hypothetical protein